MGCVACGLLQAFFFASCLAQSIALSLQELEARVSTMKSNLQRLQAQRNQLNAKVRQLHDEWQELQQPASYVGQVVRRMGNRRWADLPKQRKKLFIKFLLERW